VLLCLGSSVVAAASVAASLPAACVEFEFVALFMGASFTGRAADVSTTLSSSQLQPSSSNIYIGGSGFFPGWNETRCLLQCDRCSSFSSAVFLSSHDALCTLPPACSNTSTCLLSISFPSPKGPSDFVVASVSIDYSSSQSEEDFFSVNGCSSNCTLLLSPFENLLLLRFQVARRSAAAWVQAHPAADSVLAKPPPYPVTDLLPIQRGSASHGHTTVRCSWYCLDPLLVTITDYLRSCRFF
jgi:hypothetical protein